MLRRKINFGFKIQINYFNIFFLIDFFCLKMTKNGQNDLKKKDQIDQK